MAVSGQEERRLLLDVRRAIGDRLATGDRTITAAELAADVGTDPAAIEYVVGQLEQRRGLTISRQTRAAEGVAWEVYPA